MNPVGVRASALAPARQDLSLRKERLSAEVGAVQMVAGLEQVQLMRRAILWNFDWVVPGEARIAVALALPAIERIETVPAQIPE